jgi:hypothetical protein
MALDQFIQKIKDIATDAKSLFDTLHDIASQGNDAKANQAAELKQLADDLDTSTAQAAQARREEDIAHLDDIIATHERTLTVPGLPQSVIDDIKSDLAVKRAKRARLSSQEGTNFSGILTSAEAHKFEELIADVKKEVHRRQVIGAMLASATKIADIALNIAAKLAK